MDILKVLSTFYKDYDWVVKNNNYEDLYWADGNDISKPTLEELQDKWDNQSSEINNKQVQVDRQKQIMNNWPIEKQFEAITEFHMGRPEKLNDLIAFIEQVKIDFPKS